MHENKGVCKNEFILNYLITMVLKLFKSEDINQVSLGSSKENEMN